MNEHTHTHRSALTLF